MSENKPIFKMSVSLINKYLYYKNNPYDSNLESLKRALSGEWDSNAWTERGESFEDRVFAGEEGKFSKLIEGLKFQQWKKKYLDMGNFKIVFNAKMDAVDDDRKIVYDIKRTDMLKEESYADSSTCQHLIYQWILDEQYDFYYVIAFGPGGKINGDAAIYKEPISLEEAEEKVRALAKEFLVFLNNKGLLDLYQEKFILK